MSEAMPKNLRFSERQLWRECPSARPVIERLARYRAAQDSAVSPDSASEERQEWFCRGCGNRLSRGENYPCLICGAADPEEWRPVTETANRPEGCPTCGAKRPDEHPAAGVFGIPDPCPDPFHTPSDSASEERDDAMALRDAADEQGIDLTLADAACILLALRGEGWRLTSDSVSEERWTIGVCPHDGCEKITAPVYGQCGGIHKAQHEFVKWEPVEVVPARYKREAEEAQEQYGNLLRAGEDQDTAFEECRQALADARAEALHGFAVRDKLFADADRALADAREALKEIASSSLEQSIRAVAKRAQKGTSDG